MKELSIEEKAKRYDEAIEKARYWEKNPTVWSSDDICQKLFPELKESEDERIRNFLIDFIKVCGWTEKKDQGWPLREECIAWLEKQGEKKLLNNEQYQTIPVETLDRLYAAEKELAQLKQKVEPKFKIGDTVWLKTNTHEYTKTIEDMDDECYIFNDGRILTFNCQDDWELVERKPVDADLKDIVDKEANSIWKEINTGGSHSVIDSFNQFYGICMQVAEAVVDCKKPTEWIQELESKLSNTTPEQLAEWKEKYFKVEPAWSEEDEARFKSCIKILQASDGHDTINTKWLNSLKERVQPQNKWKESLATSDLENSLCDIQDTFSDTSYEYRTLGEAIEFIRCTEPKSHWKPSDKQMKALNEAMYHVDDSVATQIAMLIGELNKL